MGATAMTAVLPRHHRWVCLAALFGLTACVPIAATSFGIGGSTAVSHSLNGITYRTFTAPVANVKTATLSAMGRMGIRHVGTEKAGEGEVIKGTANGREIEIVLEALSPNATRMKVVARNGGIFYDSATATEIITQTGRVLGIA